MLSFPKCWFTFHVSYRTKRSEELHPSRSGNFKSIDPRSAYPASLDPFWIGNFVTLVTIHPPRAPRSRMRRRAPTRTPRLRVRVVWARGRRPRAGARWDAIWLGTSSELETTEPECLTGSTRCWGTCSQCGRQLGMLYHYWRRNNKFTLLPWLGMRYHQRVASL
jgi:hypothetical protein